MSMSMKKDVDVKKEDMLVKYGIQWTICDEDVDDIGFLAISIR